MKPSNMLGEEETGRVMLIDFEGGDPYEGVARTTIEPETRMGVRLLESCTDG